MAIATAYVPTSMPRLDVWYGDVLVANSSAIVISDGSRKTEYFGSFSYSNYGEVFGILQSVNEYQSGTLIYSVKNIGADARQAYQAIQVLADFDLAASILLGKDDIFNGSSGGDFLRSYTGNDVIYGNGGDDTLDGGAGNDIILGGTGDDNLTGGPGNDTFVKRPGESDDTITDFEKGTGPSNGDKIDVSAYELNFDQIGFETEHSGLRIQLGADSILLQGISTPELDPADFIGLGGLERGLVEDMALLYQAALDRQPDNPGLAYFVDNLREGQSLQEIANSFYVSGEFRDQFERFDNESYINQLYLNVLERPADSSGMDYWLLDIEQNGRSHADVLVSFAQSAENRANADDWLAGLDFNTSANDWFIA
jgi:hypothetical protein